MVTRCVTYDRLTEEILVEHGLAGSLIPVSPVAHVNDQCVYRSLPSAF